MIAVANWFSERVAARLGRAGSRRRRHRADRRAGAGDLADDLAAPCRLAGRAGSGWRSSPGARCPTLSSPRTGGWSRSRTADGALAVNRARPNAFTTEDWQKALMADNGRQARERCRGEPRPRPRPPISNRFRCDGDSAWRRSRERRGRRLHRRARPTSPALCSSASLIVIDDATGQDPCPPGSGHRAHQARPCPPRRQRRSRFGDGSMATAANVSFAIGEPYRPWHDHRALLTRGARHGAYISQEETDRSRSRRRYAEHRRRVANPVPPEPAERDA